MDSYTRLGQAGSVIFWEAETEGSPDNYLMVSLAHDENWRVICYTSDDQLIEWPLRNGFANHRNPGPHQNVRLHISATGDLLEAWLI